MCLVLSHSQDSICDAALSCVKLVGLVYVFVGTVVLVIVSTVLLPLQYAGEIYKYPWGIIQVLYNPAKPSGNYQSPSRTRLLLPALSSACLFICLLFVFSFFFVHEEPSLGILSTLSLKLTLVLKKVYPPK